jgi:hypothetical protein
VSIPHETNILSSSLTGFDGPKKGADRRTGGVKKNVMKINDEE